VNPSAKLAESVARTARATAIKMTHASKASHIGSALSSIDILSCLYSMRKVERENGSVEIAKIVFSKGHATAGLYAVLHALGHLTDADIQSYCEDGSKFYGHTNHLASSEIELSTGSLGHGLPFAAGIALSFYLRKDVTTKTFVVISDGECDEGTTWETALIANQLNLKNLCVIIDRNFIQSLGATEDVLKLEPLADKWKSFGWNVAECNGNDVNELMDSLQTFEGPYCLIANTSKGAGVGFMENKLEWHYRSPNEAEAAAAIAEVQGNLSAE
jgi:transketolase